MSYEMLMASTLEAQEETTVSNDANVIEDIDVIMGFNETEAEVNALEAALITISNSAKGLDGLYAFAQAQQENGGMDSNTAGGVMAGLDAVLAPFGGASRVEGMPEMEAFEGDGGRVTAGTAAMESIGKTIKDLLTKFLKMMESAHRAVMKWIDETLSNVGRLQKSADALAKAAGEKSGTPEKSKLDVRNGQYLQKGGKLGSINPSDLRALGKQVETLLTNKAIADASNEYGAAVTEALGKDADADVGPIADKYNDSMKAALELKENAVNDKRVGPPAKGKLMTAPMAIGDAFIAMVDADGTVGTVTVYGSANPESKQKMEADALNASEVAAMAKAVSELCAAINAGREVGRESDKATKAAKKVGQDLAKAFEKDGDDATQSQATTAKSVINSLGIVSRNLRVVSRDLIKQASQTAAAAYGYANASLKNLKEAK